MKTLCLLILLFCFNGCASIRQYDPGLKTHIALFEKHCNCKVDIPIKVEPILQDEEGYTTLGVCYGFKMAKLFRYIVIDKTYWQKAGFYQKESTILHELAHCVLDLEHDDTMQGIYIWVRPKSIMHPYSFPQYEMYRDEYIEELFSRKPKK